MHVSPEYVMPRHAFFLREGEASPGDHLPGSGLVCPVSAHLSGSHTCDMLRAVVRLHVIPHM